MIESDHFKEMVIVCKRTDQILDRLNDLVSQMQELKLECDVYTPREVRQWKKDTKVKFSPFLDKRESLLRMLEKRERQKAQQTENENLKRKGSINKKCIKNKLVVSAHVQKIVNLSSVEGTHFLRIQEFYENLSNNYDALVTMGEAGMLRGFVISTLNKLPHVKPDLVRTDDNWENW